MFYVNKVDCTVDWYNNVLAEGFARILLEKKNHSPGKEHFPLSLKRDSNVLPELMSSKPANYNTNVHQLFQYCLKVLDGNIIIARLTQIHIINESKCMYVASICMFKLQLKLSLNPFKTTEITSDNAAHVYFKLT